jgi:hypothetical protein
MFNWRINMETSGPVPYLHSLAAALEVTGDPLLYACVDKLARNLTGYEALFSGMDSQLRAALHFTCTEMLTGTIEACYGLMLGYQSENWQALGRDDLTIKPGEFSEYGDRIAALARLLVRIRQN